MPGMCPSVSPGDTLATLVQSTPPSELPALAAELARALTTVFARTAAAMPATPPSSPNGDSPLLTVEQAADRLGVPTTWLYRHARNLPFTKKLGHRTLRFDAKGLERWAASRPKQ